MEPDRIMSLEALFKYPNYDDLARLEYGRMLWHRADFRERMLRHWLDPRHPHCERFRRNRALVESILEDETSTLEELEGKLQEQQTSLRAAIREIPAVFGSFL
jgi:hypothetical protein